MSQVTRRYILTLTVQVEVEEDKDEIDHTWLKGELLAMFPQCQEKTIGRNIVAQVTHRDLVRDYPD